MRNRKKQVKFRSYASVTLQSIFDNCRRNEKPDIYPTTYKPLLLQSSHNFRRNTRNAYSQDNRSQSRTNLSALNFSTQDDISPIKNMLTPQQPKSMRSFRYAHNSQPVAKQRYTMRAPSETNKFFNSSIPTSSNIERFLVRLYFAKTQDLHIQPNQKQQKIFLTRLLRTITQTEFVAPQCDFGFQSILVISNYLANNPITKLVLDKNPMGDEGLLKLITLIPSLKLQQLSLVSINIGSKSGMLIFKAVTGHPTLQALNLSSPEGLNRNRINPQGYSQIKQLLSHPYCQLTHLNLASTGMGEKGFLFFCSSFQQQSISHFKTLNLSQNQITVSDTNYVFVSSCLANLSVERLELQNNNLGQVGTKILAHVVGAQYGRSQISAALVYLNISDNNIKSYGFQELCNLLPSNKKLTELHIDNNNLIEREIFYCVKHLLTYTWSIKKLSLRNTLPASPQSTYHHIKNMAEGLYRNKCLRELDISNNILSANGFFDIFQALKQNCTLKVFKMEGCGIQDHFIQKADKLMKQNKSIISLSLCNNFINQSGAHMILKILEQDHNITDLNLKKNCINLHVLNDISYQLRQNKAMVRAEDPEYMYINYIMGLQEEQKKNILTAINQMDTKTNYLNARGMALAIVEKQEQINRKQEEIKAENGKISKLEAEIVSQQKELSVRRKNMPIFKSQVIDSNSFLVTN